MMVPTETMFGRSDADGTLTAVLVLTNPSLLGYKRDFWAGTLFNQSRSDHFGAK